MSSVTRVELGGIDSGYVALAVDDGEPGVCFALRLEPIEPPSDEDGDSSVHEQAIVTPGEARAIAAALLELAAVAEAQQ